MTDSGERWTVALLDAAPDAIIVVDRAGTIILVNAQVERLFGYTRDELLGTNVDRLIPDDLREVHPRHRATYAAAPTLRPMGAGLQLSARRKDGSQFPADISLSSITTDEGLFFVAACRDVTERRAADEERERLRVLAERGRLEEQLQSSQRLESLGQLAGGVAHDFNNLLAVISNFAAFAVGELRSVEEGDQRLVSVRRDVEQIQLAAQRATTLTHQLLMFGRRDVIRPRVLLINDVIRELEPMLRRTIGEHIELISYLDLDLDRTIADRGQIEQVLVNLAVNARDAMPGGGKLTVETSNVDVDGQHPAAAGGLAPGHFVRLRISDTGEGMPADVKQRAFEPFFTTKPRGEGSGLGLATVYGIVTQSSGWCGLYSEQGVGTAVTILLPSTSRAIDTEDPTPTTDPVGDTHERVLLVEDEPALREITARILSRNGFVVVEAAEAAEALRHVEEGAPFDLLLTDVIMPGMLGRELAARCVAHQPDLAVLFMSGYAQPLLTSQGRLDPDVALVEKPFSESVLLARVRALMAETGRPRPSSSG
jgi:PAS domain S-box-containing protein